jgi:hypothetical protein
MRAYHLYIQRSLRIMSVIVLVILIMFALLLFSGILKDRRGEGPPWIMGVLFLLVVGYSAYYWVLRVPHRIIVTGDGHIEFISLVRRKRLAARDIRSITPDAGQIGFLTIRTCQDKVRILNQFDEFHEFISWLKKNNPSVELRGC